MLWPYGARGDAQRGNFEMIDAILCVLMVWYGGYLFDILKWMQPEKNI